MHAILDFSDDTITPQKNATMLYNNTYYTINVLCKTVILKKCAKVTFRTFYGLIYYLLKLHGNYVAVVFWCLFFNADEYFIIHCVAGKFPSGNDLSWNHQMNGKIVRDLSFWHTLSITLIMPTHWRLQLIKKISVAL